MGYAAIALAVMGFGLGVTFRFKVLLPFLILLLILSIVVSAAQDLNFWHTAVTVIQVQCIVQVAYFFGILLRSAVAGMRRTRPIL
jgi:hypothetical protein